MVGRWKSWAMMRYLHRTATSASDFAARMLVSGNFAITTHPTLPDNAVTLVAPLLVDERDHKLLVSAHLMTQPLHPPSHSVAFGLESTVDWAKFH